MRSIWTALRYVLTCGRRICAQGVLWGNRRDLGRNSILILPGFLIARGHTPLCVEKLLIPTSLVRSIMPLAALAGLLAATVLTATERTVKISPVRVPRVRQEANAAVLTVNRTACQTGMIAQDRIECRLILTNNRTSAIVLMPIRAKCKELPGGYHKNARFSVKMLIVFDTPSSYELDAHASRSRARFFIGSAKENHPVADTTGPFHSNDLGCLAPLLLSRSPASATSPLLGKKNQLKSARSKPN